MLYPILRSGSASGPYFCTAFTMATLEVSKYLAKETTVYHDRFSVCTVTTTTYGTSIFKTLVGLLEMKLSYRGKEGQH